MQKQTSAPAKVILFGEHAVVYGLPAIAVPLPQLRAFARFRPSDAPLEVSSAVLPRLSFSGKYDDVNLDNPLAMMVGLTVQHFGAAKIQGKIRLHSEIPVASGLGSGAAVSAALGRAVAALLDLDLPDESLNRLVFEVEKLHHGTPSGLDNTVVVYEKPIYFVKDRTRETFLQAAPLRLIVADTGVPALTRDTVADVRALYRLQPKTTQTIFNKIGGIVERARDAIECGDPPRLGALMTQNHQLLQKLDISSAALDQLVAVALDAGAYGAKLSGGGRGGNIVALVNEQNSAQVKESLLAARAKRVIEATVWGARSTQ